MRVFRITQQRYVAAALSGEGAARAPGRWNSQGVRVAYTAQHESLAKLEMLVHVDREDVPAGYRVLTFEIPDDAIAQATRLPEGWTGFPYDPRVRQVGDQWAAKGTSLALKVPSVMARDEFNVLVNPVHARFAEVRLMDDAPLAFDPRLFP